MAAAKKGKCLRRCGASSGHTTKLMQSSNLYSLDIYDCTARFVHNIQEGGGGEVTMISIDKKGTNCGNRLAS